MEQEKKGVSRREFAKSLTGIGLAAFASAAPFAQAAEQEDKIQANREKLVTKSGKPSYEVNEKVLKRFDASNLAFHVVSREIGSPWPKALGKNLFGNLLKGKTHKDIDVGSVGAARSYLAATVGLKTLNKIIGPHGEGLENKGYLSWNDLMTPPPLRVGARKPDVTDPKQLTIQAKLMARLSGADLVGISKFNRNWIYSATQQNRYSKDPAQSKKIVFKDVPTPTETDTELVIPESVNNCIVMGIAMNRPMIQTSPAALSGAATNLGYSRMGVASISLAEYIRTMGYIAIPCMNDTGASVPLAIDAGLGQAGRNGLLITPEFGPNVRICKVLTNMPMIPDQPIEFGVTQFCNTCKKCARECPSKSITMDDMSWTPRNECNNPGVKKWYNDYKKCILYWVDSGASCTNCVAVCPFTKGAIWGHDMVRWTIDNARPMDTVMLGLDDAFGYGQPRDSKEIWGMKTGTYGLDDKHFKNTMFNGDV